MFPTSKKAVIFVTSRLGLFVAPAHIFSQGLVEECIAMYVVDLPVCLWVDHLVWWQITITTLGLLMLEKRRSKCVNTFLCCFIFYHFRILNHKEHALVHTKQLINFWYESQIVHFGANQYKHWLSTVVVDRKCGLSEYLHQNCT